MQFCPKHRSMYVEMICFSICSFRYNEETFNCYTFVLAFLRCLKYPPLTDAVKSKTMFCEHFVLPKTEIAWKYIKLYRRLKDSGYFVSKINKADITECGL